LPLLTYDILPGYTAKNMVAKRNYFVWGLSFTMQGGIFVKLLEATLATKIEITV
jgi:hypothetical protein